VDIEKTFTESLDPIRQLLSNHIGKKINNFNIN